MTIRNYPTSKPSIGPLELEYVTDAVRSGWISSLGPYVTRFEEEFAAFCGVEHAVSVSNGTVALHLVLAALRIGPGDEVIVPDLSFIATANAVLMAGATPVFADIEEATLCLDPSAVEQLITPRTKVILPVHLYGHPANMPAIMSIAERHELTVIEDAAEAHGAEIGGRRVGGLGHCATFSFYGNKNLTTGEGGMITTNDGGLAERCRLLRDHAMNPERRYWHDEQGYNYRITNLQAAVGCAQLERSNELLSGRAALHTLYEAALAGAPAVTLNRTANWACNAYWMICAEVDGLNDASRERLMRDLKARGVDTRSYFYPMSDMPYLPNANTPIAHKVAKIGLNLPTYLGLEASDIDYICAQLQQVLSEIDLDAQAT
ncbi:MAG: DegT/DnrJ/EryC1/StrS family aminotransferase [Hyphomicrobiaceae bacterium]